MTYPTSAYTPEADRFFGRVRELVPSFVAVDDRGAQDWHHDEGPLGYVRIAALAWHLSELAALDQWAEVKSVLDYVEEAIRSDDAYLHELMVVGLLEDLQNACLQTEGRVRLVDVRALLGPGARCAWDELMRLWHGPPSEARGRLPDGGVPESVLPDES
jgi:hypothetical protein